MADRNLKLNIGSDSSQLKNDLNAIAAQLTQLSQLTASFNTSFAQLNTGLNQAVISNEKLAQAQQKTAQSITATIIAQEKLAQAIASRQSSEEKLAQAIAQSATQQQADLAKIAISQENVLKSVAQRESAELRLSKASEQSNRTQNIGLGDVFNNLQRNLFAINNLRFGIQSFGAIANGVFQQLAGSAAKFEDQFIQF